MGLDRSQGAADRISSLSVPRTADLGVVQQSILEFRLWQMRYAAQTDPASVASAPKKMSEFAHKVDDRLGDYLSKCTSVTDKEGAEGLKAGWNHFVSASSSRSSEILSSPKVGIHIVEKELRPIYKKEIEPLIPKVVEQNTAAAKKESEESRKYSAGTKRAVILTLGLSLIIGTLVAWLISAWIVKGIRNLSSRMESLSGRCVHQLTIGLERLAEGDLTYSVAVETEPIPLIGSDEIGRMTRTFNEMLERIRRAVESYRSSQEGLGALVSGVRSVSSQVDETSTALASVSQQTRIASSEIADGSSNLAVAANEASTVTQRITNAVAEVTQQTEIQSRSLSNSISRLSGASDTVAKVADSARRMTDLARDGGRSVEETAAAMSRVREKVSVSNQSVRELDSKGQEIGSIVEAIQAIAEQTNLLALNAAIEAARAGEQGRGFAVVADEVRKLAERASAATREISNLIEDLRETVAQTVSGIDGVSGEAETAASRSQEAAEALLRIVEASQDVAALTEGVSKETTAVADTMSEVTTAAIEVLAREMSDGIGRVRDSIGHVAAVSDQSAAGAEELTASIEGVSSAAVRLSSMSQELAERLMRFRVADGPQRSSQLRLAA
jgi:methyl-accepting chemotaxis protein